MRLHQKNKIDFFKTDKTHCKIYTFCNSAQNLKFKFLKLKTYTKFLILSFYKNINILKIHIRYIYIIFFIGTYIFKLFYFYEIWVYNLTVGNQSNYWIGNIKINYTAHYSIIQYVYLGLQFFEKFFNFLYLFFIYNTYFCCCSCCLSDIMNLRNKNY